MDDRPEGEKPEWLRIYEAQVAAGMTDDVRDMGDIDMPPPTQTTPEQAAQDAVENLAFMWPKLKPAPKEPNKLLEAGMKANQWIHEPPPKETVDWYQKEYPELKTAEKDITKAQKEMEQASTMVMRKGGGPIPGMTTSGDPANLARKLQGKSEVLYKSTAPESVHKALEGSRLRETGGGSAIEKAVKALREKKE